MRRPAGVCKGDFQIARPYRPARPARPAPVSRPGLAVGFEKFLGHPAFEPTDRPFPPADFLATTLASHVQWSVLNERIFSIATVDGSGNWFSHKFTIPCLQPVGWPFEWSMPFSLAPARK